MTLGLRASTEPEAASAAPPRLDLVHGAEDQVAQAVAPVFNAGGLVHHEIFGAFLEGHVLQALDRVLAARVNE